MDLLAFMRAHGEDFQRDAAAIFQHLVFRCLIDQRGDDLSKLSFVGTAAGQWRLAPGYGLRPYVRQTPTAGRAAMSDPPSVDVAERLAQLRSDAPHFNLKPDAALQLARHVLYAFNRWQNIAQQFDVGLKHQDFDWLSGLLTPRLARARSALA